MRVGLSWVYGKMVWSAGDQEMVDAMLEGREREVKAAKARSKLAQMSGAN